MIARCYLGDTRITGKEAAEVLLSSRGLAYGDGLFETMRMHRGTIHWWSAHWARMAQGVARMQLRLPDRRVVDSEIEALLHPQAQHSVDDAVVKWILMRGRSARGYAPDNDSPPVWTLSLHQLPPSPRSSGLVLRWCDSRLATHPSLAGLKHCNRLEQILARAEWNDPQIDDGLICDTDGFVVSATSANLFVLRDGRWQTPMLDRCGIAGICRAWAIAALDADECRLMPDDVERADAVFLCNAVRGILPVAQLGNRAWSAHPAVAQAMHRLAFVHPAFIATGAAFDDVSDVISSTTFEDRP